MIGLMLLMLVGGIALTQAVSDPRAVTLRWLRLGGIIALTLLAVAAAVVVMTRPDEAMRASGGAGVVGGALAGVGVCVAAQLVLVQLGRRRAQRVAAAAAFIAASAAVTWIIGSDWPAPQADWLGNWATEPPAGDGGATPGQWLALGASVTAGAGLLGGFLMTMLLGHAYLTAGGEMTQHPFGRLVLLLGGLLVARLVLSAAFGLWPYWMSEAAGQGAVGAAPGGPWTLTLTAARLGVGLIVPLVFTYMVYDCVRRRSNQSATGILYVASVLIVVGEGSALALLDATGMVF